MIEAKYSEAAVEVLDILNYTDKEDVKKIPQSFIKFLSEEIGFLVFGFCRKS